MLPFSSGAQKGVTTFGLQIKPVFPSSFFESHTEATLPHILGTLDLSGGLAFGMVVRAGISKNISFETGLNQITRRYDLSLSNDTSGYSEKDQIRFVGYEMPLLAMVYIRLGQRSWMNNAIGASLDFYPSDVQRVLEEGRVYFFKRNWVEAGVVGNVGVEYRTDHSGYFYLGATYHRPFGDMALVDFTWYEKDDTPHTARTPLSGAYLTVDIRYFFNPAPKHHGAHGGADEE